MNTTTITILKTTHDSMLEQLMWLEALEAAGVDNWSGYDEAREIFREMQQDQ